MLNEAKAAIISCIEENYVTNKTDALTIKIEELSNSFELSILKQALLDLKDENDPLYVTLQNKLNFINYFCKEIVIAYTFKLRLYFNVNTNEIPHDLKKIFYKSFEMQNSSNSNMFLTGFILSKLCYEVLDTLISKDLIIFDNLITIDEVNDLYTVLLYEYLYKRKCIKKCPAYIKDICKLSYINDKLVSVEGWIIYFSKKSLSSIKKDIELLRNYKFDDFAIVLDKICKSIEENLSTDKKQEYIKKLINKNKNHILNVINKTSIQEIVIEYLKQM